MGLASLLQNTPSDWIILYHLSFVEKFAKKNTFGHKSIRKWSLCSILKTLQEKKRVDPVRLFPEQTVKVFWQNASAQELSNKHHHIACLVSKELTSTKCCRLAHSKVQNYMLRDTLKLGAAAANVQWGNTI
eukprot:g23946.t1